MSRTAAQAAQAAAEWAERAESAYSMASVRRAEGDACTARRGAQSEAVDWHEKAEASELERSIAAEMARMWADVAGVLHLVQEGEPS
ncbi:hypothetical protein ACFWBB_26650 [Streptomyces sp. NPDC060000]|uniref:hypothetical protein n=1 Tax=Streptomyces sp. NPDC060000 TaxID=3347031 RepID=UPI00368FFF2B